MLRAMLFVLNWAWNFFYRDEKTERKKKKKKKQRNIELDLKRNIPWKLNARARADTFL